MIALGDDNNIKLYLGSDEVLRAYLGDEQVYPNTQPSYASQYLTFEAIEGTSFQFNQNGLEYSLDEGSTWNSLGASENTPYLDRGDKIMFRGNMQIMSGYGIGQFSSYGKFNIEGNPLSLVDDTNFADITDLTGMNQIFFQLFYNTYVVDASNLALPATILSQDCYAEMFSWCRYLTEAPQLPALKLADYCYQHMFEDCTSLETAPDLPALVATNGCYQNMFFGCTSLNYIKCLATDISATYCTTSWVNGVAASGTFVKNTYSNWPAGTNGIPTGWTEQTAISDNQLVKTVFDIPSSGSTRIVRNVTNVTDVIVDGVAQNSSITTYNFSTTGEHTVDFVLTDPTQIEQSMFYGNSTTNNVPYMKSVIIPEGVETVGSWAFANATSLESLTIADSVITINGSMLNNCTNFKNWNINPNAKLQQINGNIFNYSGVEHIVIPKNVTAMGSSNGGTIRYCAHLQDITIYATTPPTLTGSGWWENCPNLTAIYVPSASVTTYQAASGWSDKSSRIQAIP